MAQSYRHERIASTIRAALSGVLRNLCSLDKYFDGRGVHCTSVKVSQDLRQCRIYVSLGTGSTGSIDELVAALNSHKARIRFLLAKEVSLRFFPDIFFMKESKSDNVARVYEILFGIEAQKLGNGAS